MSAIAGIYHSNKEPISFDHRVGIMKALEHFPADDIQTWQKDNIFLGCHAQWITPESIEELLPYYDYERQLAITADAIIDNRADLFERLQVGKVNRKEMSDSQLILLAYQKWGEESPKHLIGDFAFMIWDEKKQLLFGARDFSGSRTLYYFNTEQRFAFSTTIKPLFSLPYIDKKLNEQWLAEFLAIPDMFNTVDTSSTVYKNIKQIPPSHTITVCEGRMRFARYSRLSSGDKLKLKSDQEYEEAFQSIFQNAVTARLRTNHNVGAHLSGGLDSGSVVSFAARALRKENKRLHTFSYVPVEGFTDWTPRSRVADERPFIRSTVEHVGNITDHYLDFKEKNSLSDINDWLEMLEMPYKFFENSFWMKGIYEQAHQQGIRLLLNGARGNYTISWGSALDYYAQLLKKLRWVRLYDEIRLYGQNKGIGRKRLLTAVGKKAFPLINHLVASENKYYFPLLINPQFAKRTNVLEKLQQHGIDITGSSIPNAYQAREKQFEQLFIWGNGTSATKLSLRYSLWNRDPTNDLRVIRFCLSLPDSQFIRNGLDRSLIRRSTENLLPDKVRLNQRIRGVQGADGINRMTPAWDTFIEEIEQLSIDPVMAEFLNVQVIEAAISKIRGKPRPEYVFYPEFKILMRSLIVHRFIKNSLEGR